MSFHPYLAVFYASPRLYHENCNGSFGFMCAIQSEGTMYVLKEVALYIAPPLRNSRLEHSELNITLS